MTIAKKPHPTRAAKAWRLMFDFLMRTSSQRLESLQKLGLTPNDSRVLFGLDESGKPIGVLARELACDPSTATWLVDRLERLGFAERRPSEQDRRVKLVALTAKGAKSMEELLEEYHRPPPELDALSIQKLDELIGILKKLEPAEHSPTPTSEVKFSKANEVPSLPLSCF